MSKDRRVAEDTVKCHYVSTVRLLSPEQDEKGRSLLYETMVFCTHGTKCFIDERHVQYPTRKRAQIGHAEMVNLIRNFEVPHE